MTIVVSSLEAFLYLVQDGRGIAWLPDFSYKKALAAGEVKMVLDKHMTQSTTFWILWPSSKQMTPKVRAFVDFVAERFKQELVA